jgi:peptidoglycan hydrolase-like protein with peptidoglycan-binding domain
MKATLQRLKKVLGLSGKELLDGPMQEALGYQLLKDRGFNEFIAGRRSRTAFGLGLAQEWASLPVLVATKGQKRKVARGQSYYAGDGVNKALVSPERVEAMLDQVKAASTGKAPAAIPSRVPKQPEASASVDKETVARIQEQLWTLGYTEVGSRGADGKFDGKVGTMTATAIRAFRAENGLPAGDDIDDALLLALQKAKPRVLAPARSEAPPEEVREKVPEVKANWLSKVGGYIVGIPAAIGAVVKPALDNIPVAKTYIDPLTTMASDIPGWVWLAGVAAIAGALVLVARHGEQKGVEAFQSGARR